MILRKYTYVTSGYISHFVHDFIEIVSYFLHDWTTHRQTNKQLTHNFKIVRIHFSVDFSNQNEILVKDAGIICLFLYFCVDRMCQIYQKTAVPVVLTCYLASTSAGSAERWQSVVVRVSGQNESSVMEYAKLLTLWRRIFPQINFTCPHLIKTVNPTNRTPAGAVICGRMSCVWTWWS